MSVESYEEFINENIFVSNDGISKYIFEFYYIISTFGENETKLIIESVYSDFIDDSVVSYNELLNRELNDFSIIYQLPIIFFVLIAVVSFVNMNITIKLLVKDRIKFIKTLYIVGMKFSDLVKIGFSRVKNTLEEVKTHKNIGLFLIAFYLMSDALVALFAFIPIYARTTLQLTVSEIAVIFLIIQLIAFPTTLIFGIISDKISSKKMLLTTLCLWIIIVIL
ncbi:MAG TPA: hypothetical protein DHV05_08325, partial [Acholeplasmataceae bacterium]|nr:hypothetical protein [Acholeplasmataceae bacterium]